MARLTPPSTSVLYSVPLIGDRRTFGTLLLCLTRETLALGITNLTGHLALVAPCASGWHAGIADFNGQLFDESD